jgi:hypothetical protein
MVLYLSLGAGLAMLNGWELLVLIALGITAPVWYPGLHVTLKALVGVVKRPEQLETPTTISPLLTPNVLSRGIQRLRSTDSTIAAAMIIALGLVLGGFLFGGIYEAHTGVKGMVIYRINRFTGATAACAIGQAGREIPEDGPKVPAG